MPCSDITQRGRDIEGVLKQYMNMVKPSYSNYIAPTMAHADIIVPRGGENKVAIQLIVQHVHTQLQLRGFKLRERLAHSYIGQPKPDSLYLLPNTPQIKGLHTFIRNQETPRDEFIFYSKRLIRLVIEYALGLLPFKETTVDTPQVVPYQGKRMACNRICGVSILRAGETMEQAVCDVCKDIRIGKILIQTNQSTGEPEVSDICLRCFNGLCADVIVCPAAVLPAPAQGHPRLPRHPDGRYGCHRCGRNDGHPGAAGLRCARGEHPSGVAANGRDRCALDCVRFPEGMCVCVRGVPDMW